MDDFTPLLDAIRIVPNCPTSWLALAGWLRDNGRDDEAASVRMFYPGLQESLERGATLESTLAIVQRNAARLAKQARPIEEQSVCQPSRD